MPSNLGDTELITLLNRQFGTKALAMYYLKKAKDAAGRAKVDLANQNPHSLGANTQQMIDAIEMVYKVLGPDERLIEDKKSTT